MLAFVAELWGLYEELKLAFSKGISCLEVHVDSKSMVDSIKGGKNGCVVGLRLIKGIQQLLAQEWTIKLVSIFKEANKCVDAIANEAWRGLKLTLILIFQVVCACFKDSKGSPQLLLK